MAPLPQTESTESGVASLKGLIADAQGTYHDISKAAFDAYALRNPQSHKHLATKLLEQPIVKSVHEMAKKFGVDLGSYDQVDLRGLAGSLGKHVGAKFMAAGTGFASSAALGAETLASGGVAVGMAALESAIEWAISNWDKTEVEYTYKRGDWVVIDKGQKTNAKLDRELDWMMGQDFQDMPSISEMHVLERVEDFHVGFYIGPSNTTGSVTVFDLLTGREEEHPLFECKLLPMAKRSALDMDEFASKVRELYFAKEDGVYFECEVSCEPGTEVIFQESLWHIVSCDGYIALIENDEGSRQNVSMKLLTRSRQERVGPQHLYNSGEATGFVTTPGGIQVGDWVWIDLGAETLELGVVHIIRGDEVWVYAAATGIRKSVSFIQVHLANRDDCEMLNGMKVFSLFRRAAIEGLNTVHNRLGAKYLPVTRVKREELKPREEPKIAMEPAPVFRDNSEAPPVETQSDARYVDALEETQNLYGIPMQDGKLELCAAQHRRLVAATECRDGTLDSGAPDQIPQQRPDGMGKSGFEEMHRRNDEDKVLAQSQNINQEELFRQWNIQSFSELKKEDIRVQDGVRYYLFTHTGTGEDWVLWESGRVERKTTAEGRLGTKGYSGRKPAVKLGNGNNNTLLIGVACVGAAAYFLL